MIINVWCEGWHRLIISDDMTVTGFEEMTSKTLQKQEFQIQLHMSLSQVPNVLGRRVDAGLYVRMLVEGDCAPLVYELFSDAV